MRMVDIPKNTESKVNTLQKLKLVPRIYDTVTNLAEPLASWRSARSCGKIAVNHVIVPPVAMYLSCFLVCSTTGMPCDRRASRLGLVLALMAYSSQCTGALRGSKLSNQSRVKHSRIGDHGISPN